MRESSAALRAYADYLAQSPPRSLDRLAQRYQSGTEVAPPTRRLTTLKQWSTQHGWGERIAAHERALAAEREAEDAEKRRKLREARIGVAVEMQTLGLKALRSAERITPYAAVQMIHEAHDTQRRDLGEPDQRVEVSGPDGGHIQFTISIDRAAASDDV